MFSQTVEYALRAMVQLAYAGPSGSSTDELAIKTQVPRAYLSKVLQGLRSAGFLKSQRGVGGGICLILEPENVTILDVVNAVEPIVRIHTCPLNIQSHGRNLCPLHTKMDCTYASIEASLSSTTLADVIAGKSIGLLPLCGVPNPAELMVQ